MFLRLLQHAGGEIRILTSRKSRIQPKINCSSDWYGTLDGGFYINPGLLNNKSIVYSFGIGENISFDTDIINKHNCTIYAFDSTPKSIIWIEQQMLPATFNFHPYGLNKRNGILNFYLRGNKHNTSEKNLTVAVSVRSFTDITRQLEHKHIDVLKLDIEGSEYEVLDSILKSRIEIVQVLVKINEKLFADGRSRTKKLFASMKEHGYEIFAVSDDMEKVSFIRSKYLLQCNLLQ
jgi:FkbM family methyltransferase